MREMAPSSQTLAAILSFLTLLLISANSVRAFSLDSSDDTDPEFYTLDRPQSSSLRSRSQFLSSVIRKGAHCDPVTYNICNGVSANNGTAILNCCKTHCRNILGDRNNCGLCSHKCGFGQLCCSGVCTDIAYNPDHCGKCGIKCLPGLRCDYGVCGYA